MRCQFDEIAETFLKCNDDSNMSGVCMRVQASIALCRTGGCNVSLGHMAIRTGRLYHPTLRIRQLVSVGRGGTNS